jgi:hypothetical protein
LLVCRNAAYSVVELYLATLPNSLISMNSFFLVESLGFLHTRTYPSAILNRSGENGHACYGFSKCLSTFHHDYYGFFIYGFYYVGVFFFYS